jgi:hypothetical protein
VPEANKSTVPSQFQLHCISHGALKNASAADSPQSTSTAVANWNKAEKAIEYVAIVS